MIFNDLTGAGVGICNDIDFLLSTDATSYPLIQKARNVNRRLDEAIALIMQADGRWEWDDSNNIDSPIGTINLVDGTQSYSIPAGTYLKILRMEVKDINGNYYLLAPISQRDVQSQAMSEFQKTAGRPIYYDKLGDFVFLYPAPSSANVTTTSGLKVYYQRLPSYFVSTDTTKTPGFSPLFHRILSLGAALDYCLANTILLKSEFLTPLLQNMQSEMITFYAQRSGDERPRMRLRSENYTGDVEGLNSVSYPRISDRIAY